MQNQLTTIINKAISYLTRREHSQSELKQKLNNFDEQLVEQAIDQLKQKKLQSDERFCEMIIQTRMSQGKGKNWLLQELKQHQICLEIIDNTMVEISSEQWVECCHQTWLKKFGKAELSNLPFKELQKQRRFLTNRGFMTDDWKSFL